jgi:hypothetical protein
MPGLEFLRSRRAPLGVRGLMAHLPGFLRAVVCLCTILGVGLLLSLRQAEARLGEMMLGFGEELSAWQGLKPGSAPRRLFMNGAELGLLTLTTQLSVHDALELFDQECARRGGLQLPQALSSLQQLKLPLRGVLRRETTSVGTLACFDSGGPLELTDLNDRVRRFREAGNLQEVGQLRYVSARREGDKTHLLVFWTEGETALLRMFPKAGDAPGRDPSFPRPERLRRLLSASEAGAPYGLAVYRDEAGRSLSDLQTVYGRALRASGWTIEPADESTLIARRAGRTVLLRIAVSATGETVATVAELG